MSDNDIYVGVTMTQLVEKNFIRLYHSTTFGEDQEEYVTEKSLSKESLTLTDVLEVVEEWLRGCGYSFDGHLEIVE